MTKLDNYAQYFCGLNEAGYNLIPLKPGTKIPALATWKEYQQKKYPVSGIIGAERAGVICGTISGNLYTFDFDNKFGDADFNLNNFLEIASEIIPDITSFSIIDTPSGGFHLPVRCVEPVPKNEVFARRGKVDVEGEPILDNNGNQITEVLIESRGEGGYIATGKGYSELPIQVRTLEKHELNYLIEAAKCLNEYQPPVIEKTTRTYSKDDSRPGDLYDNDPLSIDEVKRLLIESGWTNTGRKNWTRPGKNAKDGTSATFGHVASNVFYVFSANASPFEANKAYTPFAIKTLLEYNGDYHRCAIDLAVKYQPIISAKKKEQSLQPQQPGSHFCMLTMKEAIEAGEKMPDPLKICGAFLRRGINTYLYSQTNYGKTALAIQIAIAAATGQSINDCEALRNECQPMRVLYLDMELNNKDIQLRYPKEITNNPNFDNLRFIREGATVEPLYGAEILYELEKTAVQHKAELIVIDNITKILPDSVDGKEATKIISFLKRITDKTGAFFLVVGHTTKLIEGVSITENSYYGSAHIKNFFQEIFLLDACIDGRNKFFLRHVKTKFKEMYKDTVPVFTREMDPEKGLGFRLENFRNYKEVKLPDTKKAGGKREINVNEFNEEIYLLSKNKIRSSKIAKMFDCTPQYINSIIKNIEDAKVYQSRKFF